MKANKLFTLASALTIALASTNLAAYTSTQTLNVSSADSGFLYQTLVKHSDSLKISYVKEEKNIQCWIERTHKGVEQSSTPVNVKPNKFSVKPLSACLSRKQAMEWLSKR
uniref:hypothetical protein n=1 Tax=Ningiella ruwaisensis TaxID=2364274 RepID=UPI0010A0446F|nr:hypothetical protein [Ningiella ruwaisensis]